MQDKLIKLEEENLTLRIMIEILEKQILEAVAKNVLADVVKEWIKEKEKSE